MITTTPHGLRTYTNTKTTTATTVLKSLIVIPTKKQYLLIKLICTLLIAIQLPQYTLAASVFTTTTRFSTSSYPSTFLSVLNFNDLRLHQHQQQQQQRQQLLQHSHIISCNELRSLRKRKRQIGNWHDFSNTNEQRPSSSSSSSSSEAVAASTSLLSDCVNPCGGKYIDRKMRNKMNNIISNKRRRKLRQQHLLKKVWRKLQKVIKNEYKTLKLITPLISLNDIHIWRADQEYYNVLPKLQLNTTVSLRRWHRHLQIYVASFAYLRRVHVHWAYNNSLVTQGFTKELKILKLSARNVLCNIEAALNSTLAITETDRNKEKKLKLFVFKNQTMEKKLKFQTDMKLQQSWHSTYSSKYEIDMKFAKYYYFHYLRRMIKNLKYNLKKLQKRHI